MKPISIDPGQGITIDSIDASLHSDNPMRSSVEEARECYGDNPRVRCIPGIGTGYTGVFGSSEKGIHAADLIGALKKLATDSVQEHNQWATRFTGSDNLCHCFNLDRGAKVSRFRSGIQSTTTESTSKPMWRKYPLEKGYRFSGDAALRVTA